MKITDRVKTVPGVLSAYWNSHLNNLTVYYSDSVPLDSVKICVTAMVADLGLARAVERFIFISQIEG